MLSIPFFVMLGLLPEVRSGFRTSFTPLYIQEQGINVTAARALVVLLVNLLTQDMCVKGVNRLTTVSVVHHILQRCCPLIVVALSYVPL
jgi:UDP-xylose/UDP-N-acetylglucosamine transporter B4